MKTQKEFVEHCLACYSEQGLEPGNPDDGDWEVAHYPLPQPEGTETVLLLHEHHQVQGLLQSEEVGRCCFLLGSAKKFLLQKTLVDDWFELWELYYKWSSFLTSGTIKKLHGEKDENGKSALAVKAANALHAKKDEQGRSAQAVKNFGHLNDEKDEDGKSVHARRGARASHAKKNEEGKSAGSAAGGKAAHAKKDENGLSLLALRTLGQRGRCLECGLITTLGSLGSHQRWSGHKGREKVEGGK